MPALAIVIPCHGIADYLSECLETVCAETSPIEVILVDDASTDGTAELADSWAGRDTRVKVIHLASNVGPGRARTLGLKVVRAPYVWFIDGDDRLIPGAISRLVDAVHVDRPDLVQFGFSLFSDDGWSRAVPLDETASRSQLLWAPTVVWSRVFRTETLRSLGCNFDNGPHGDITVAIRSVLTAETITVLPECLYAYRTHRPGSITNTPSRAHMGVIDTYAEVLEWAKQNSEISSGFGDLLYRMARRQFLLTLTDPARLENAWHREFHLRAAESLAAWRKAIPQARRGWSLRDRLIEGGHWRLMAVALRAVSTYRGARGGLTALAPTV